VQSIRLGGFPGQTSIYYFHNCPGSILFARPNLTGANPREKILTELQGIPILMVSDAGAARDIMIQHDWLRREPGSGF